MEGEGFRLLYLGLWGGHFLAKGIGWLDPLQYSCLESPVDRGAWWAALHGVAQSRTGLKRLSMHACIGEGNGNPLQYSCLENPRDRGAWWASVCGVTQSWTQLKRLSNSSSSNRCVVVSHVVLICISLMISDIEHLNFQCLLAIYTSFLQNLLFKSFAHF